MPYFCYTCVQERTLCPPGDEPGSCAVVEAEAAAYRRQLDGKHVYFGSVPGGSTDTARKMDHTRKFDQDMHAYREARRHGEQPDQVSTAAVERNRRRQALVEKAVKEGRWGG